MLSRTARPGLRSLTHMSGLLHPQGPEPARTYWIRRGILLAVVIFLIVMIVIGVKNLTRSVVATAPAPTITPPAGSTGPTPASSSLVSGSSITPTPSVSTSAKAAPSQTGTSATSKSATSASKTPAKATPTAAATPDCSSADLRVKLKGDRTLSTGKKNTFKLSLINTSKATCLASVTDKNFELKIYSGTDRIWSSEDCAKVLAGFDKKLAAGADTNWTMTWNGKRSVKGKSCKVGSPTPRPGTYWATAQLAGAKPVQLAMIIR